MRLLVVVRLLLSLPLPPVILSEFQVVVSRIFIACYKLVLRGDSANEVGKKGKHNTHSDQQSVNKTGRMGPGSRDGDSHHAKAPCWGFPLCLFGDQSSHPPTTEPLFFFARAQEVRNMFLVRPVAMPVRSASLRLTPDRGARPRAHSLVAR